MSTTAAPQAYHRIKEVHDLKCPMRDGVNLATDVFMPTEGGPFPTVLIRSPYDRGAEGTYTVPTAVSLAQRGYAVVAQDVRGRYDSDGDWYPFVNEANDGQDALDWVARQPWCSGVIGMSGGSYHGLAQWQAAQGGSPHLVALVPRVAYSNAYHNWVYTGGAFQLAFNLSWSISNSTRTGRRQYMWLPDEMNLSTLMWHLPLKTSDEAAGRDIRHWKDWVSHPSYDDYWRSMRPVDEHYQEMQVPSYGMTGWYDVFLQGTLNNFMGMTGSAKTPEARRGQRIIVGPWIHPMAGLGTESTTGDIDFGPNALIDLLDEQTRWFDYWLRDIDDGIATEPRVKIFVMGANRWRESDDWPIPGTRYTPYYFHSGGEANSLQGDGYLDTTPPEEEKPDEYVYDPADPVITAGGSTCCSEADVPVSMGPRDQQPNESRHDVLVYTTPPLERDVEVTGPVKVVLYASSSARDTDFCSKLVDVFPNGYAMNAAQGIIRARSRDSWERQTPIEPGTTYKFEIDLWSTSNCFLKGQSIRVEITSSNFPQFDRNPNTGHAFGQDAEMVKADQTVFHDAERPSHVLLPVIP